MAGMVCIASRIGRITPSSRSLREVMTPMGTEMMTVRIMAVLTRATVLMASAHSPTNCMTRSPPPTSSPVRSEASLRPKSPMSTTHTGQGTQRRKFSMALNTLVRPSLMVSRTGERLMMAQSIATSTPPPMGTRGVLRSNWRRATAAATMAATIMRMPYRARTLCMIITPHLIRDFPF